MNEQKSTSGVNRAPFDLHREIQRHIARVAIGASTVRGKGNTGIKHVATEFCAGIDLAPFASDGDAGFTRALEAATTALLGKFREKNKVEFSSDRGWGLARKVINIFLRDCAYTAYLRDRFRLDRVVPLLEVPMDRRSADTIIALSPPRTLSWPGVKNLQRDLNKRFQDAATRIAREMRFCEPDGEVARVHLDARAWGGPR